MVKEKQMMEFNGIPLGHLYRPDTSVSTLTHKSINVTSLKNIEERIGKTTVTQSIDYTDLEDIDDTMDMDLAKIGLIECNIPEIPEGYNLPKQGISEIIQKAIQASEEYLKREDKA